MTLPRPRAARSQRVAFEAQIDLARETGKPLVIHTREAAEDTPRAARAARERRPRDPPLLLDGRAAQRCIDSGYWLSFAGNVTYPSASELAEVAASAPLERLLVETDAPYLAPQSRRGKPNEPSSSSRPRSSSPRLRGNRPRRARGGGRAKRRRAVRLVSGAATQPSLRRLREFGVRPRRDLGQNFLIDSNILAVIERAGELQADDVVLEVGGGLGVLSEYLAARAAHVHVVEIDRALEPALRDALDAFANATLHFADAMALDLAALEPAPDEGDREPALRDRGGRDPAHASRSCRRSRAGSRWSSARSASGSPRRAGSRSLRRAERALPARLRGPGAARRSRARVFLPVPNVDSVLVGMTRSGPAPPPQLRRFVRRRVRPPPQGARRARSRSAIGADPRRACARRSSRSDTAPTRAPSSSRRPSCEALWEALGR